MSPECSVRSRVDGDGDLSGNKIQTDSEKETLCSFVCSYVVDSISALRCSVVC